MWLWLKKTLFIYYYPLKHLPRSWKPLSVLFCHCFSWQIAYIHYQRIWKISKLYLQFTINHFVKDIIFWQHNDIHCQNSEVELSKVDWLAVTDCPLCSVSERIEKYKKKQIYKISIDLFWHFPPGKQQKHFRFI